jgi:hypothetical protein
MTLHAIGDSANLLGNISVWTLRKHISKGSIRTVRLGRRVFLASQEIERIQREGLPSLATLKGTGASLNELKSFTGDEAPKDPA